MTRRKSERMKALQRLCDHREQEAAQALGSAQQQLDAQQQQLNELQQYRHEYTRQFYANGQAGMNGAALQEFQDFLRQLDQLIEQQRQQVGRAAELSQEKKSQWQARHTDTSIYDKVIARFRAREQMEQQRRSQREQDDRPARGSRRDDD